MLGQLADELGKPAGVLELELFAAGPGTVDRPKLFGAFGFPAARHHLDLRAELRCCLGFGAHAGGADDDGDCPLRIIDSEMQCGEPAHRKADNMGLIDFQVIEYVDCIVDCTSLRIALHRVRHFGWRISACIVGNASIPAREKTDLKLPGAIIAGELVNKQDGPAGASILVIQFHAIARRQIGHGTIYLLTRLAAS
jgi:hypothetical protein